ncbi:MAG: phage integrase SAM-like domain-containing protein [Odoribacter sp.]|nr:phage integrase SAM-like domain-containing protein [Odoribacter sp.]
MYVSISIICYKSKTLSNGEHPLMLRIAKDGKKKYISIRVSVHPDHWNFTKNEPKSKCPNKDLINKIILDKKAEYQKKILEFSSEQKEYTALSLVENNKARFASKTVIDFYEELIKGFKDAGRTGNNSIYTNSLNSLKAFTHNKLNILFSDIDVDWLNRYEQWQRSNKNKETTISLQFRTLRSAYNKAIEAKVASDKFYPFKEFNINKFNTKTNKRALSKEEIMKIITTDTTNATYMH